MEKKKLKLEDLKITSFITALGEESRNFKGGDFGVEVQAGNVDATRGCISNNAAVACVVADVPTAAFNCPTHLYAQPGTAVLVIGVWACENK